MKYFLTMVTLLMLAATWGLWSVSFSSISPLDILSYLRVKPPACLAASNMIGFGRGFLRFQAPNNVTVREENGIDSNLFTIDGPSGTAKLLFGEGTGAATWEGSSEFELWEKDRQVKLFRPDDFDAMDIKVRNAMGGRSRLIGTLFAMAYYKAASERDASFFDQIMDTACFCNPFQIENRRMLEGQLYMDCRNYIIRPRGIEQCVNKH